MKQQFFGIFFYWLYLLAMIRPIFPIIEYHANYDYISTVLCENRDRPYLECNGKCYLEKQLKKSNHSHDDHSNIPSINMDDYPMSPITEFTYQIKNLDSFYIENKSSKFRYSSQEYVSTVFKPPKYIS